MYIIATRPYHFSWTITGVCNYTGDKFTIENNYIKSGELYLSHADNNIVFTDNINIADKITLIKQKDRHNVYKISINDLYIRHSCSHIMLSPYDNTELFDSDSNWLFFDTLRLNNVSIVIARYNEDVSWLHYLSDKYKIYLYNKGDDNIYGHKEYKLPNIGRESHTYLHHIITNYTTLSDKTIFLQGDPFPHSPYILELLSVDMPDKFKGLSLWYSETWPIPKITNSFHHPGKHNYSTDYTLTEDLRYTNSTIKFYLMGGSRNIKQQVIDFMKIHKIYKLSPGYSVTLAALFSCTREGILKYDISIYSSLLEDAIANKVTGFIMELLWGTILA